jgi:hypothetical protein
MEKNAGDRRSVHWSFALALLVTLLRAIPACRPPSISPEVIVTGQEYAFQLPDTLKAGRVILRFHNAGKVQHEMVLVLLKPGITLAKVLETVKAGGSPDSLVEGTLGVLIAAPGTTSLGALAADLSPGRTYALVCTFQDAPDKPPHLMLGMVASRAVPVAQ